MEGISRREFVSGAVAGVAAVACSVSVRGAYLQFKEGPTSTSKPAGFDAGPVADVKDGISDDFINAQKFLLVKTDGKIYAVSSTCLHEKGTLKSGGDGTIRCTKHAPGQYDITGKPTGGPPMRRHANDHLTRFGVSVKDGHLIVDRSKTFTKDSDFTKDGAFVKA